MSRKRQNKNQSNRQLNMENARRRAEARDRISRARTLHAVDTVDPDADGLVEIVDLPEDSLAGKAMAHMDGVTITEPGEAAAEAAAQTVAGGHKGLPGGLLQTVSKGWRELPIWGKGLTVLGVVFALLLVVSVGLVGRFLSRIGRATDNEVTVAASMSEVVEEETEEAAEAATNTSPLDTMDPNDITWYGQTIEPMQDDDIKNILLIGQDRRKKEGRKRSDAMIIVSLNQETGDIKLCSFLRDTYVQIPGYGGNKLNRAYELGGMELLDETIEDNFGVHIDNNVEVDFFGFVDAMSVIGNLDIELSQEEIDFMEAHPTWADDSGADVTTWDLHAGVNSMRPEEYAVYCRLRMVGNNDMERTERQRRVLTAAFKKVMQGGILYELSVADAIIPYITTDMTDGEILGYVYTVVTKGMEISSQYRIPYDGTFDGEIIDGASVVVCDMEANTIALQDYLYGDLEGDPIVSEEERAAERGEGTTEDATEDATESTTENTTERVEVDESDTEDYTY